MWTLAGVALLGGLGFSASALNLGAAVPSADGVVYVTQYPNGDAPIPGCVAPTGYTEVSLGDGGGEICEQSETEYDFGVSGSEQPANYRIAHKDAGAADVQVEARFTDSYAGASSNFANIGMGIRESAASTSWLFQCHSLLSGAGVFQVQYGSNGTYTTANGTSGARPRYCAVTYDVSTGDIKAHESADSSTWTVIASTNRAMSDVLCYMGGTSRLTSETLAATLDGWACGATIDAYTPGGGGGGGPTLVTAIENQSLAQHTAFSLNVAANFSGETSFTANLPAGTGLTFNTATGVFGGTPDIDDVTASPYNVEVCGVNGGGTTCDTPQFTVSAVPGDTFTIPTASTARTFDCTVAGDWSGLGGSGTPGPGDIISLAGGTHTSGTATSGRPLRFNNCNGSPTAPLIIRNDVTDNEPAIIRRTVGANSAGFVMQFTNVNDIELRGDGKYTGADSGAPGVVDSAGTRTLNRGNRYGIIIDRHTDANKPAGWLKFDDRSCVNGSCLIVGIKVDGGDATPAGGGSCFDINDHGTVRSGSEWRGPITLSSSWGLNCGGTTGGEGVYFGPNLSDTTDIPFRNITVNNNIFDESGRDGINVKGLGDGTNSISDNYIRAAGQTGETTQNSGIAVQFESSLTIDGNEIYRPGGDCISLFFQNRAYGEAGTLLVENNVCAEMGQNGGTLRGRGIHGGRPSTAEALTATIRSNTISDTIAAGVNCFDSFTATAANNIIADPNGTTAIVGCTSLSNTTGTVAAQDFAAEVSDNYELTSTSPACSVATANVPSTDLLGRSSEGAGRDDGAYESTACP